MLSFIKRSSSNQSQYVKILIPATFIRGRRCANRSGLARTPTHTRAHAHTSTQAAIDELHERRGASACRTGGWGRATANEMSWTKQLSRFCYVHEKHGRRHLQHAAFNEKLNHENEKRTLCGTLCTQHETHTARGRTIRALPGLVCAARSDFYAMRATTTSPDILRQITLALHNISASTPICFPLCCCTVVFSPKSNVNSRSLCTEKNQFMTEMTDDKHCYSSLVANDEIRNDFIW